jgi:hypothetical protein
MTDPAMAFPTANGRFYKTESRRIAVPSVTNVMKQKNKPAINKHNVKQAAMYAVENYDTLHGLKPEEAQHLIKESIYSPNPASAIGDVVHNWIDCWIKTGLPPWEHEVQYGLPTNDKGEPTQPRYEAQPITARRMWRQFEGWYAEYHGRYNLQFIDAEFTCWSDTYGYAGTADWAATMSDLLVLGDTKTGNGVYDDTGMQIAALVKADVIMTQDGRELPMPKFDRGAVLHLRPTYAKLIPVEHLDSCFQSFLGCLAIFKHEAEFKDTIMGAVAKVQTDYKGV